MTKRLKNIMIGLFATLAFVLTGTFFAGCGIDYSKISLVPDQTTVNLAVGEQKDVLVKIDGFQSGFSNRVTITKENPAIFKTSVENVAEDEIKITITALQGGSSSMTVSTWEGGKTCSLQVNVQQASSFITPNQDLLYVSGSTPFVPNASMFNFSENTTIRQLSFFYIKHVNPLGGAEDDDFDGDLNEYTFQGFQNGRAVFEQGESREEFSAVQFDKISLQEDALGEVHLQASFTNPETGETQQTTLDAGSKFLLLTTYQPSDEASDIFNVRDVFVLRDLDVSITGGYLQQTLGSYVVRQVGGEDGFAPIFENVEGVATARPITIIPNRRDFVQYVLRIETPAFAPQTPISLQMNKTNDNVVIDFLDCEVADEIDPLKDPAKHVYYIQIAQNTLREASTKLSLRVFYDIAKNVGDQSVNFEYEFDIDTQIAPAGILINGREMPEEFVLYTNNFNDFGWKEFYVDVISDFQSEPTFDGVTFEYPFASLDVEVFNSRTSTWSPVRQGQVYSDLEMPFRVKGRDGALQTDDAQIGIKVVNSGILQQLGEDTLSTTIDCVVRMGSDHISVRDEYPVDAYFYVDYEIASQQFSAQLFADRPFEFFTCNFVSGVDAVDIALNSQPCLAKLENGKTLYYLNLTLLPKAIGSGKYDFFLDNGATISVTFDCRKFLKQSTTSISLTPNDNSAVTFSQKYSSDDSSFLDTLYIEILNPSDRNSIIFGNSATFEIVANVDSSNIAVDAASDFLTISHLANRYTLTTRERNGETTIKFTLTGQRLIENDFRLDDQELTIIDLFVNVSTYSLVDEFYLANNGSYAYSRNVYFGTSTIANEEKEVDYDAVANHPESRNFFQRVLDPSRLPEIFDDENLEGIDPIRENGALTGEYSLYGFTINEAAFDSIFPQQLVHDSFSASGNKFVTFSLLDGDGDVLASTIINGVLTRYVNGVEEKSKNIRFTIRGGHMIWLDEMYEYTTDATGVRLRYVLTFPNLTYTVAGYGEFDFASMTYSNNFTNAERPITFSAQISQRGKSLRFDSDVNITRYLPVETISLPTRLTQIDFSSQKLTETIAVYTYPISSTNNNIQIQFVPTGSKAYPSMVEWTVDRTNAANGVFVITISCENFYNNNALHDGIPIEEIETALTGELYIFPADWGSSYTSLIDGHTPISLSLQYRNGSRANPYILEDADDVANINLNETTLRSHYELRTSISLASSNLLPIGILDGKIVGFSGSIIGTTSQAGFTDVIISQNSFLQCVGEGEDAKNYGGLFAQISSLGVLENFSISGKVELDLDAQDSYIGLLAAQNFGSIKNVGATVDASTIHTTAKNLYLGGLVGLNYGTITQDLRAYDGTGYHYHKYSTTVVGSTPEEFVDGVGYVTTFGATAIMEDSEIGRCAVAGGVQIRVDEQNFAIDENGIRIKFDEEGNILQKSRDMSGQTPKNMAFFNADMLVEAAQSDAEIRIYAGGVCGANSGRIERFSPTNPDFNTYGYAAYSAYARIQVAGQASHVALGGIAGLASYYATERDFSMPAPKKADVQDEGNVLDNLLVGGKLSTISMPDFADGKFDYVGGLVGYATTMGVSTLTLSSNTVRTFVHGLKYVGGLVGFEQVFGGDDEKVRHVTYGSKEQKNLFQAVDDAEGSLAAASILRVIAFEENDLRKFNAAFGDASFAGSNLVLSMVGNSYDNGRIYNEIEAEVPDTFLAIEDLFEAETYVTRSVIDLLPEDGNENATLGYGSQETYYGDFVVVGRNTYHNAETSSDELTGTYDVKLSKKFTQKIINLELERSKFSMTPQSEAENLPDVLFMYYFHVESDVAQTLGSFAQNEIERLNFVTPYMSEFYPLNFVLSNPEVSITATSGMIDIDMNGNITLKGTGIGTLTISSLLNARESRVVYVYVVNYFNPSISSSIFFAPSSQFEDQRIENSEVTIYGDSYVQLFMQPNYALSQQQTADGETFAVTDDGVLMFRNVAYLLSSSSQLSASAETDAEERFSSADVIGQRVVFKRMNSSSVQDVYDLVPILRTTIKIDGEEYVFYKKLDKAGTKIYLNYSESATAILLLGGDKLSMATNQELDETILIETTNPPGQEMLFYEIRRLDGGYVQAKHPQTITDETFKDYGDEDDSADAKYLNYLNDYSDSHLAGGAKNDLFAITFKRLQQLGSDGAMHITNNFAFNLQVNKNSSHYANRFDTPITGQYLFTFFATNGNISDSFVLTLDEAQLSYVSVNNFSDLQNVNAPNEVVEPGTKGLLEISLNPLDAIFDRFTISNDAINDGEGAGKAQFTFAYRTSTGFGELQGFGNFENGNVLTFTYQEMKARLEEIALRDATIRPYVGKIYVTYFMASYNVQDNVPVAFNVSVTPFEGSGVTQFATISLKTKIGSFARFAVDGKTLQNGGYYVARGLSYDLSLQTSGFEESQVSVRMKNQGDFVPLTEIAAGRTFEYFTLSKVDGQYVLQIASTHIPYNDAENFEIDIEVLASKVINSVVVESLSTLKIFVMEYVFNYHYQSGENQDIVGQMRNGVVNIAVGNPFTPELAIWNLLEYDHSNADVLLEVENFVAEMSAHVTWSVVLDGQETILTAGSQTIRTPYYLINGLTITPIRLYSSAEDIYHFAVNGFYNISSGRYHFSNSPEGANVLHSEFAFDVHDQSAKESPIPIRTYQELLDMQPDSWYILLHDIDIPNAADCLEGGLENFAPITTQIAGLDGNGFAFNFSGIYDFATETAAGLFGTVAEGALLQNIIIRLQSDVTFHMNQSSFDVALLAAVNEGIITNAQTEATFGASFSVNSAVLASDASVAGLVAENEGIITNSRTTVDISAPYDLAGFAAANRGQISSSFFRGASLRNTSSRTQERAAGFVLDNSGEIYTSYVSGDMENDFEDGVRMNNQSSMYYHGGSSVPANTITSGNNVSGFVYHNTGTIEDSYSNIYLYQNGRGAGFVYENSSRIARCFSTSVLASRNVESFGFAEQNTIVDANQQRQGGTIEDCYFLQHQAEGLDDQDVNFSVKTLENDENTDITPLDIKNFKFIFDRNTQQLENPEAVNGKIPFEGFAVSYGRNTNSVWFYDDTFEGMKTGFNGTNFNLYRPELVAPNVKANSQRNLENVETIVDPQTGAEYSKYTYVYDVGTPTLGSEYNPILLTDAQDFETYILRECDSMSNNYANYRLVSDIDFREYDDNSALYRVNFLGSLEGNFMSLSGINLQAADEGQFAGLFASIAAEDDNVGTVMNLTYSPNTVSFANAEVVGGLVGKLDGGKLINIQMPQSNGSVIIGKNIVGGMVGMAVGDFEIKCVSSDYGATATSQSISSNNFDVEATNFQNCSFAGSVAGVLSGTGVVQNVKSDNTLAVMGAKIGLLFGLIDSRVRASDIRLNMHASDMLNGYQYAGLVAGESKGTISNVQILGSDAFGGFRTNPYVPVAVGGFAGLVSGGRLDGISMTQDLSLSTISSDKGIEFMGGIAGEISAGVTVSNIDVECDILGFNYVGGVAGKISADNQVVKFENINVDANLSVVGRMVEDVGIAGLAAYVLSGSIISLDATEVDGEQQYNHFNIGAHVNIYIYSEQFEVNTLSIDVGAILGRCGSRAHTIAHTISSLHKADDVSGDDIVVDDLSMVGQPELSSHVEVVADEEGLPILSNTSQHQEMGLPWSSFNVSHYAVAGCKSYCNLTAVQSATIYLENISIFGDIVLEDALEM